MDSRNTGDKFGNFLRSNRSTLFYLVLLLIITCSITYSRIMVQIKMGPVSDSVVFLANALTMAGQGTGYSNLLFPPFFSFVVSLFFRMGYIYSSTIFYIDGAFFVLGVVGLYLLLKLKFNDIESFLGALLYATFPIILVVFGVGLSDLPGVCITIWAFYFLVLAVERNSKFFYLAVPFFMLAFLTRYNNALLIFPFLIYLLINRERINYKNLAGGLVAAFLVIIPVFIFFFEQFGNVLYPFLNFASSSNMSTGATVNAYYNPNIYFFLEKLPVLIGNIGFVILLGSILALFIYITWNLVHDERLRSLKTALNQEMILYKLLALFLTILVFLITFGKIQYLVSEILFVIIAFILNEILKIGNVKHSDLHTLFLSWFMAFFIFHSTFVLKDVRYFIVMIPPIAYFMILGLSEISKRIKLEYNGRNITFTLLAVIISILAISSAVSQMPLIMQGNQDNVLFNQEISSASTWISVNDPGYKDQEIYSDLWPNFSWELKTDVKPVPVFKGNNSFFIGVINFSFDQADSDKFNSYLVNNNADYYLSVRQGLNLTSYTPVKNFGDLIIYKRIH
ncbi:MAG: glycosyltransferase family 39 protein [Methanobacterium sp.]|nr:glycosyltransferase family 39 protein [Methanobacterium sp.]